MKIINLLKSKSELFQRITLTIPLLVLIGVPVIVGGNLFAILLFLLAVFASSEYSAIKKTPSIFVLLYIFFVIFLLFAMRLSPFGLQKIVLLAFIIACFDSTAYAFGKIFGKTKLCHKISQGKTVEGFAGGVLATMLISVPLGIILNIQISNLFLAIFVGIIAILSQIGDIIESAFKRRGNVKDSGTILLGHGGILDRFDGYILTTPVFFAATTIFNLF
jgi:phosphatidate cytidylyltransferase